MKCVNECALYFYKNDYQFLLDFQCLSKVHFRTKTRKKKESIYIQLNHSDLQPPRVDVSIGEWV